MKKAAFLALSLLFVAAVGYSDCSTLTNITEAIPEMTVGQPVNFQIEFIGGTPPYTFSIYSGTLPAGLHLNKNGVLHGVPREVTDTTVLILVTDAAGCTLGVAYPFRVNP